MKRMLLVILILIQQYCYSGLYSAAKDYINSYKTWKIKACIDQSVIVHCYLAVFDQNNNHIDSIGFYSELVDKDTIKRSRAEYSPGDKCSRKPVVKGSKDIVYNKHWKTILEIYEKNKFNYDLLKNNCCSVAEIAWRQISKDSENNVNFPFANANLGIGTRKNWASNTFNEIDSGLRRVYKLVSKLFKI